MKLWWQLWSGHVLTGLTVVILYFAFVLTIESMRGTTADSMFWYFVAASLCFLIGAIVGIMATWRFKTHRDRYYMRRQDALERRGMVGMGAHVRSENSPRPEAYSPDEGDTYA